MLEQVIENNRILIRIEELVRWMEVGFQEAGIYSSREKAIYWDGKSQDGEPVSSGVYFYSLELDGESQTR